MKEYYKRNLPHWQPTDAVFFITVRLSGSLPKNAVLDLKEQRAFAVKELKDKELPEDELEEALTRCHDLYFGKFDDLLDNSTTGPHWLKQDNIAQIWTDALKYFDEERYKLICSTVMSNHVHFIFYKLDRQLVDAMHSLKSYTSNEANKALNRTGAFWTHESYDRVIRGRVELQAKVNYVLNNPVKIGLVNHWSEWKHNYIRPEYMKFVLT